jgi:hypothetical protein
MDLDAEHVRRKEDVVVRIYDLRIPGAVAGPRNSVAGVAGIGVAPLGPGTEMLVTPLIGGGNTPIPPVPVPVPPVAAPPPPAKPAIPTEPPAPVVLRDRLGLNVHADEIATKIPISTPVRQNHARRDTDSISFMGGRSRSVQREVAMCARTKRGRNVRAGHK